MAKNSRLTVTRYGTRVRQTSDEFEVIEIHIRDTATFSQEPANSLLLESDPAYDEHPRAFETNTIVCWQTH